MPAHDAMVDALRAMSVLQFFKLSAVEGGGRGGAHISHSITPKEYTSACLDSVPSVSSSGGMCVTVPKLRSSSRTARIWGGTDHPPHPTPHDGNAVLSRVTLMSCDQRQNAKHSSTARECRTAHVWLQPCSTSVCSDEDVLTCLSTQEHRWS